MKPFIYLSLVAMLLTGTASMQAQNKNKTKAKTQAKAKSQKTSNKATTKSTAKILYVEPEDRNYAQNLGGHMFWDYTAREGNALLTDWKISKEDYKKMVEKYTYKTFEEAYQNLPVLPDPSQVDSILQRGGGHPW